MGLACQAPRTLSMFIFLAEARRRCAGVFYCRVRRQPSRWHQRRQERRCLQRSCLLRSSSNQAGSCPEQASCCALGSEQLQPDQALQVRPATGGAAGREDGAIASAAGGSATQIGLPPAAAAAHRRSTTAANSKTLLPPASGLCTHLRCTVSLLPSPFPIIGLSHFPCLAS